MKDIMDDWSVFEVKLRPLSRQLSEQMGRREWMEAAETAQQLSNVVSKIHAVALMEEMSTWHRHPKRK
jgi:hypothetical protein